MASPLRPILLINVLKTKIKPYETLLMLDINSQNWEAGLNASSRFDLYRDFKTISNREYYLDCIQQQCFKDALVPVRLGIRNLKVHMNGYVRSDLAQGNDCPFCLGFQENELHLFFVCNA